MNLVCQSGYKEHAAQHILYYHKRQPVHVGLRPQSDCFHYWPTEPFLHTTATDRHMKPQSYCYYYQDHREKTL